MKKVFKWLLYIVAFVLIIVGLLITFVKTMLPNVGPAPDIKVEFTPERLERGAYLANSVSVCMHCHSKHDRSLFAGPPVDGTFGQGGEEFGPDLGFPGLYVASNITPANLKDWTDGEVFRVITTGVGKEGRPLFSIMPHHNFGQMDEEDILSIITYIRSLPPIENDTKPSESFFPMNIIVNTIPKKANLSPMPPKNDIVAYGKYLVTAASCNDCHTKQEKGKVVGEPFAGGFEFIFPDKSLVKSANITPHASGIGGWTAEQFVSRFKAFADSSYIPAQIKPGVFQSPMPWTMYGSMEAQDLKAIFAYLQTLTPIDNEVVRYTPHARD